MSWLSAAIDAADVRWIWLTHPDRDHTGGLHDLLEAPPQARVVTTFSGVGILSTERPLPMERVYLLNPGQQLDVGDRMLSGLRPPLFDNPPPSASSTTRRVHCSRPTASARRCQQATRPSRATCAS